ncbi:Gem-associated protein 5 [Podila horticola]|nr:Gem-associated protein 5 [Podila horticola]
MVWPGSVFAFTISMDRRIITWDVEDRLGLAQIDCLGGNVYSLDIGPLDPRRIAMGCGNNMIKIWDTMSQGEPYACQNIENLYNKIRTVKWHPVEEGKLAFGLEDGKVGFIDNLYQSIDGNHGDDQGKQGKQPRKQGKKGKLPQSPTFFQSYHTMEVGTLAWCSPKVFEAPVPELFDLSLKESSFCVMSCGSEGKILVSDASKPTNRGLDLDSVLRQQNQVWYQSQKTVRGIEHPVRRCFAIHHNEDLLAIGNDDGSVEVYELKYFRLVYVYQGHKKRVESLKWNWAGDNTGEATTAYLLASGADDGRVSIHQLDQFARTTISDTHQKPNQDILPTTQCFVSIHGHSKGISDMAWSPHCQGSAVQKLATTSYDGNVLVHELRVDDVSPETSAQEDDTSVEQALDSTGSSTTAAKHRVVACFTKHGHAALSVHWSLTDVDRIYSGGNDWTLWNWDWKSHPDDRNSGGKRPKKKKIASNDQAEPLEIPPAETTTSEPLQLPSHYQPEDNSVAKLLEEVAAMKEKILAGTASTLETPTEIQANFLKREIDVHPTVPSSPTPSKRAKTTESSNQYRPQAYNPPQAETTHAKKALFPMSTAAFQVQSKQTVHLEIIRLVRNIYCRRYRHGISVDDAEMEATRRRWKAMQEFFEKDTDGVALSKALREDLDEMNLPMDTDDRAIETDVTEAKSGPPSTQSETVSKGDLIFYGSREAVIALAEMEAQEISLGSNYFLPGTGFGVTQCPPVQRAAQQRKPKAQSGALAQIPISYWLGDVPKMSDILTSLPASEMGVHDWIGIALSPMGGVEAWKDIMAKTAVKFLSRREVHAAVLCLLGIGRVYDAVDAYRSQGLFREALMLLRIRTMEDDEDVEEQEEGGDSDDHTQEHTSEDSDSSSSRDLSLLHIQILAEWGQVLDKKGLYEQACKCQLALTSLLQRAENRTRRQKDSGLSKPSIALSTLARRMDVATLRTAAGLAILLQDVSQQERIEAYESAKASKEESDQIRRAAALERQSISTI